MLYQRDYHKGYFIDIDHRFLDPHCRILIVRITSYIREYESVSDRVAKERHGRLASVLLVTIGLDRARSSALTRHRQNSTVQAASLCSTTAVDIRHGNYRDYGEYRHVLNRA